MHLLINRLVYAFKLQSMSVWFLIIIYGAIQGLFLSLVLYFSKHFKKQQKGFLIALLLFLSALSVDYVLANIYAFTYGIPYPAGGWIAPIWMLISPFFYFVFRSFILKKKLNGKQLIFHFIPFVINVLAIIPFISLSAQERHEIALAYSLGEEMSFLHLVLKLTYHFQVLIYPILILSSLRINLNT